MTKCARLANCFQLKAVKSAHIFLRKKFDKIELSSAIGGNTIARRITPDELVDSEIERLKKSDAVKLAKKEQRYIYRKRQYLAQLKWLERRGLALMAEGWTADTLELLFRDIPEETER